MSSIPPDNDPGLTEGATAIPKEGSGGASEALTGVIDGPPRTTPPVSRSHGQRLYEAVWRAGPRIADTLLPFALVLYLALEGGGYDSVVRSEVGVAAWWLLVLGAILGLLPRCRPSRTGWILLALLAALTVWTGLGMIWSESAERSAQELVRVASLLGVFALGLSIQGPGSLRRSLAAIAAAIGLVAFLALGSRFHPSLYPADSVAEFLPSERARLNYPLGYWNGLAALMALGLPLLLWFASSARSIVGRGVAAAALPALILTVYMTLSRGGAIEALVALAVIFALAPRRLELLPATLLAALGGGLLIALVSAREDLVDGVTSELAATQGDEMLVLTLLTCAIVGLLGAGLALAVKRGKITLPRVGAAEARKLAIATGALGLLAAAVFVASGNVGEQWEEFKQPITPDDNAGRFSSASGSGRYQWWSAAVDAAQDEPVLGIGPGTFEYFWARRETTVPGFVRDAHSVYLETLGELGIPGLLLILCLIGSVLVTGIRRSLRRRQELERTGLLAAATASTVAFAVAAAGDWVWEMTVLPVIFLLLAAAIVSLDQPPDRESRDGISGGRRLFQRNIRRIGAVGVGIVATVIIGVTLLGTMALRDSQREAEVGLLSEAQTSAQRAADLQPYASAPYLQEALVAELAGDLSRAARAAREATSKEPTNWRTWLVRARVDAARSRVKPATRAYRRARSLNPRSTLFAPLP